MMTAVKRRQKVSETEKHVACVVITRSNLFWLSKAKKSFTALTFLVLFVSRQKGHDHLKSEREFP